MEQSERIYFLLQQVQERTATPAECDELLWLISVNEDGKTVHTITSYHLDYIRLLTTPRPPALIDWSAAASEVLQVSKTIDQELALIRPIRRVPFLRKWGWAAAAIILVSAAGAYFLAAHKKNTPSAEMAATTVDIAPGKDGAILTLADGSQVVLDSLENGVIASQNGSEVILRNGQLAYDLTGEPSNAVTYNTMSTPKGRQYQLTLPDGTRVWLNSGSSIRYPTLFTGKERRVEMQGEVYFEVAKNTKMPFRVHVDERVVVEVLGTHFNVNAYENEKALNTTLLEGSVKVIRNNQRNVLRPGEQAQVTDMINVAKNVDLVKVLAWKNGLFNFKDVTLEEVMRQLERWYDIEVVYENGAPDIELAGELTRDVPLQGLLKNLGKMGLHYRLVGRKLMILPSSGV